MKGAPAFRRTETTLGFHLRSARLGFRWSELLSCYMRVSGHEGQWLIELTPADQVPNTMTSDRHYRCWWDQPSLEEELSQIVTRPAGGGGRAVLKVDRLRRLIVDDDAHVLEIQS